MQMEGYSIDAQKEFLVSYCKMHEIESYEFYTDGGYTGSNINRPDLNRLIDDVENHKIDLVVVFKLDRLSRSQKDTLFLIEEVFNPHNCGFVSIKENFDTNTPFGKAMVGILSVFAQLERETILERTKIGRRKRAEEGLWYGTGNLPYAYDYDLNSGVLIPNEERVEKLNKMIELYLQGIPMTKVAEAFHMKDQTLRNILTSSVNIGMIPYKDEEFIGKHKPIIDKDTYDKIQQMIEYKSNNYKHANYLLAGKIICGICGAKYRYQKAGNTSVRLYCYSRQKSKKHLVKDETCNNKNYYDYEIEEIVINDLIAMSLDENKFRHNMNISEVTLMDAKKDRIKEIDKQLNNLINSIKEGIDLNLVKDKIKELQIEKENIQEELSEDNKRIKKKENIKKTINNLSDAWENLSFQEKRNIILELIDKVVVNDNEVSIYYNF